MSSITRGARRVGIAAVGCALVLVPAAASSGSVDRASKTKLRGSNFYSNCRFSRISDDDPIVYPGQPGRSHSHTFFGNRSTNAFSTVARLRRAATTCYPRADKAAYWVPTLYQDGREIRPSKAQFYYVVRGYDQMHAFPRGLRIVAGDPHAARAQSTHVTYWACGGRAARTAPSQTVPAHCGVIEGHGLALLPGHNRPTIVHWRTKSFLELHVLFPDCWDGKHHDSPDHHSHMTYSRNYVCPRAQPVKVPLIRLNIRYPIDRGRGVSLASGGQNPAHADFFNAWNQRALRRLVDECFHGRCNEAQR